MPSKICRYCNHLVMQNGVCICRRKNKVIEYHKTKWNRRCSDYELNPIDALGENIRGYLPKEYRPKKKKGKGDDRRTCD